MKIDIIVTNWNGLTLLKKNLVNLIKSSPEATNIILADDASTDESLKFANEISKKYKKLKIINNKSNLGFGTNTNNAVKLSGADFVVLLNNDIYPYRGYISSAIPHLEDQNVAGVGFAEKNHENYARIFWKSGYLQHQPGYSSKTHLTAWVSGGSSIIRRQTFLKLGGFDQVYAPFYCEDQDWGYRALKSGYKLLWEPKALVDHHHETTISKFPKRFLDYVKERNRLLTVWRNITDQKLLLSHNIAVIGRLLSGPNYLKIIMAARRQIQNHPPSVVFPRISDREIFNLFRT